MAVVARNRVPPSFVSKTKRCVLPVVKVGAVSDGNFTELGHVTVPEVWVSSRTKANDRLDGTFEKVNVEFPSHDRVQ